MKRTHCCVLPWQQWLRERTTVLLHTYIAWFVPHSFWFIIQSFIFLWFDDVWWEQVRASSNEQRINRGKYFGSPFVLCVCKHAIQVSDEPPGCSVCVCVCVCVIKLFVGGRSCNVRARAYVRVCVCSEVWYCLSWNLMRKKFERFSNYRLT